MDLIKLNRKYDWKHNRRRIKYALIRRESSMPEFIRSLRHAIRCGNNLPFKNIVIDSLKLKECVLQYKRLLEVILKEKYLMMAYRKAHRKDNNV